MSLSKENQRNLIAGLGALASAAVAYAIYSYMSAAPKEGGAED